MKYSGNAKIQVPYYVLFRCTCNFGRFEVINFVLQNEFACCYTPSDEGGVEKIRDFFTIIVKMFVYFNLKLFILSR